MRTVRAPDRERRVPLAVAAGGGRWRWPLAVAAGGGRWPGRWRWPLARAQTGRRTGAGRAAPRWPGTEVAPPGLDAPPPPTPPPPPVAITDLLGRVPFPTPERPGPDAGRAGRTFEIELPRAGRIGPPLPHRPPAAPSRGAAEPLADPPGDTDGEPRTRPAEPPAAPGRPPLSSRAVALTGGLTLLSLALAVALGAASGDAHPAPAVGPAVASLGPPARPMSAFSQAPPSADPVPIPVDLLTRLEEADRKPLDVELGRLLDAVQYGFGTRSAQLEPTLRSYAYRTSSRLAWTPDTFRVAVTAPDPALAAARGARLARLFEDATATGQLQVGTGAGAHALTLVSE